MPNIETIYNQWLEGEIRDQDAITALTDHYVRIEDNLEPLEQTKTILRAYISEVVERVGGKVEVPGFGTYSMTNASITASYDTQKLDKLVAKLVLTHPEIAQQIAATRKESSRTGGLRVNRSKKG